MITLGILATFTLLSCGNDAPAKKKSRPLSFTKVISLDRTENTYSGTVAASQFSDLAFKMSGLIVKMNVKEGQRMKKGDILIISEISRLSRSLTEIMTIMGQCLERQISIYTTKERYTFDNSINSKVLCFAFGLVAEIERNLISMRTKEALAVKKAEGVVLGRRAESDVKMEVIRQNEARIEAMLSAGLSVTKMCRKIGVSRNTWYKYLRVKQDSFC